MHKSIFWKRGVHGFHHILKGIHDPKSDYELLMPIFAVSHYAYIHGLNLLQTTEAYYLHKP